ncbi:MAG: hypothetical protein KAT17_06845 [Candidatus Aminicenantes bacterium]|nr:hypothetical protein [Candidatus Aminicenantes bacterium]
MDSLALNIKEMGITDLPDPEEVILTLKGFDPGSDTLKFKEGSKILTGEEIFPGEHSTVTGTLKSIDSLQVAGGKRVALRIRVAEDEKFDPAIKEVPDFLEKDPLEILKQLNRCNLKFSEKLAQTKTVVISAVDTEPLATIQQQILRENKNRILEGLELIKFLTAAQKVVLAIPKNLDYLVADIIEDQADVFLVDPVYPNGLPDILMRTIYYKLGLEACAYLKVEKLFGAVIALKQGRPFVHKVVTIIGNKESKNIRIRIGTPIKNLFKDSDIHDNDKLILGGPLRGDACYSTDIPVGDTIDLVYLQDSSEVILNRNQACINCGKCVRVCPAELDVNLICRFSEFSHFEECLELDVYDCIECGLCAYHCPSGRSLVQFIRLAKSELEKIEQEEEK